MLLGPNGSGKSTLLLHVLGLLKAQRGAGAASSVARRTTCRPSAGARRRAPAAGGRADHRADGVGRRRLHPAQHGPAPAGGDRLVEAALRRLEIWHLRARVPHALSAGERRKVALAGAIVFATPPLPGGDGAPGRPGFGPGLLVLDEPFASLDPRSRATLLEPARGAAPRPRHRRPDDHALGRGGARARRPGLRPGPGRPDHGQRDAGGGLRPAGNARGAGRRAPGALAAVPVARAAGHLPAPRVHRRAGSGRAGRLLPRRRRLPPADRARGRTGGPGAEREG